MISNKSWSSFKTYFETEHSELKLVQGNTIQIAAFYQVNYMAGQVLQ